MRWRYRTVALALAFLALFATSVARMAVSPLVPDVIAEWTLSRSAVGLAFTGMWAAIALVQFPAGVLGDRYGERGVLLAGIGLSAAGGALLAASSVLLTREYDDTGRALGVYVAADPLGGLVGPVVAAAIAVRWGWRAGLLPGVVAVLVALVLLLRWLRPTPPVRPDRTLADAFDPRDLLELLSRGPIAFTTGIAAVTGFVWQSFVSFFPTFLVEYHGLTQGEASLVFGGAFALSTVALPLAGALSDRVGRDTVLAGGFSLVAAGLVAFLAGSGAPALLAGTLLVGSGLNWGGALQSRYMDALGADERGTGFGLVRTVGVLLGASGSVVTGTLVDVAGWGVAYGLAAALFAGLVAVLALNRVAGCDL